MLSPAKNLDWESQPQHTSATAIVNCAAVLEPSFGNIACIPRIQVSRMAAWCDAPVQLNAANLRGIAKEKAGGRSPPAPRLTTVEG